MKGIPPSLGLPSPCGRGAGGEGKLPSPCGRGAGGEGGFRYASLLNPRPPSPALPPCRGKGVTPLALWERGRG